MAGRISAQQEAFEISDSSASSDLDILEPFTPGSSSTKGVKRRRQDDDTGPVRGVDEAAREVDGSGLQKRKPPTEEELAVKVEWTDDSDGGYERLKKKKTTPSRGRGGKKATGAKKGDVKGKGKAAASTSASSSSRGTARRRGAKRGFVNDTDSIKHGATHHGDDSNDDEGDLTIPEYIRQRRREFDEKRAALKEAGLRLPPDYADIYFSDDDRRQWGRNSRGDGQRTAMRGELACRPQFENSVRPSRERKDIALEYSGGIIPACIAQYLRDYQVAGVQFLHQMFVYQRGGILGDDMGLGKTVQVAAFLTAAFGKTGDERDDKRMRKMRRAEATTGDDGEDGEDQTGGRWYPRVLVVCPGSLIQNWRNELQRWGWWHVDLYHGAGKEDVLQAARTGRLEIMVTTYVTYKNHRDRINSVRWDAVVADECHVLKEKSSETTKAMNEVNALCRIGLTGTAIQNRYEELWTLLNWTNPGRFGTLSEWRQTISRPLTLGQSHDATVYQLSVARTTAKKLVQNLLPDFFLRRMKSLIADQLPRKTDRVVFCPLTDRQTQAYANFIDSEQVDFLRQATQTCDCGRPGKRGWCCYKTLPGTETTWFSLVFPTIQSLLKLANHLTLLVPLTDAIIPTESAESNHVDGGGGSSGDDCHLPAVVKAANDRHKRSMGVLKVCCPDDWETLYRNRDSLVNLANPEFCGKWKVLRKLLRFWHENGDKVLVFSHNVRLLRILQHLFHNTSYSVSYLDGSLSYEERQRVVDDFNSDPAQFVFLISTKAGGVGLNITSANKVVIFDPHWNPAYDLQAQDRAYRIGQVRDVDVFRLVSAGTIEEIVYARQIYKQQQANIGYSASTERRYFRGVQEDSERKGEIFGLNNLFTFHTNQVVLRDIVNKTNIAEAKAGVHLTTIDMEQAAADKDIDVLVKIEGAAGANQLANALDPPVKDEDEEDKKGKSGENAGPKPKSDAIQAILASAGVEYTHDNSEVVGSSKVEAQLSRHAEMALGEGDENVDNHNNSRAYGSSASDDEEDGFLEHTPPPRRAPRESTGGAADVSLVFPPDDLFTLQLSEHLRYNPPDDVARRQFCTLAKEAGFATSTDFALVVEGWTPEQRRECLESFYRKREQRLREIMEEGRETEDDEVVDANTGAAPWGGDETAQADSQMIDAPAAGVSPALSAEHQNAPRNESAADAATLVPDVVEPLVIVSDTVIERRQPYIPSQESGDTKEQKTKSQVKLDRAASNEDGPIPLPRLKRETEPTPASQQVRVKREPGTQIIIDTQGETQGEPSLPEVRVKREDTGAADDRVVVMLSSSPTMAPSPPPAAAEASLQEIPALPPPAGSRPSYEVIDDSDDTDEL
ncbi:dna excision repair protein [Ophiostoma piceae UAMH 11346]|uniref:Dna excision repair protein n=1 Tax=Ophiostoma piceae (strain UAMH 11346) TaxID=1262450 RepID=S3BW22_OPHP1|nr:dna excision repair protein [Ophiostoma piceae UAMH 11346]